MTDPGPNDPTGPGTPQGGGTEAPNSGAPRWMRVALVLSLAANLLILGIVAGAVLDRRGSDRRAMPRDAASAVYLRALPHDDRTALVEAFRAAAPDERDRGAVLREEITATLALMRAEPFDPAALATRIAGQRDALAGRSRLGDRLLIGRLAAMTVAERQAYADRLEALLSRAIHSRRE